MIAVVLVVQNPAPISMLEQTDQQLQTWVTGVLGKVPISLSAPDEQTRGVNLYLLDLLPTPPPSTQRITPLQFSVRYLVSTRDDDPATAHRQLGELVLAALADEEMEVDLEPVPAALWAAFGLPPRPAFFLRLLVRQPRPEPEVHYVRQPLRLRTTPAVTLVGLLHGPEAIPIAGARVELAGLNRSTVTGPDGRFRFAAVPAEGPAQLVVKARGRTLAISVSGPTSEAEPAIIQMDLA